MHSLLFLKFTIHKKQFTIVFKTMSFVVNLDFIFDGAACGILVP